MADRGSATLSTTRSSESQRAAVTVALEPANGIEDGALAGAFDLVLA